MKLPRCQRYVKVKGQRVPDGSGTQPQLAGHGAGFAVGYRHDVGSELLSSCLDVDAAIILDKSIDVLTIANISTGRSRGLRHGHIESRAPDHRDLRFWSIQVDR
jgi:hypothetical protein